jgi:hypothetical protein
MISGGTVRSTAGTSSKTTGADGAIWGGSNHAGLTSLSGLTTPASEQYVTGIFFGQEYSYLAYNLYTSNQIFVDPRIRNIGDLFYVAGGGGNGMGVQTLALYGQGGSAGTDIAGGNQGLIASATVISQTGGTATTPSAGGGGGGASYNTGTDGGAGGAGANGAVIIYWGM